MLCWLNSKTQKLHQEIKILRGHSRMSSNKFQENIGAGFCKYDMTTAEKLSMKELNTCFESSVTREFAKEITEQYSASQAQYLKCKKYLIK